MPGACTIFERLGTSRFFVHNGMYQRYNFHVPTPFYHLSLAEEIISHPSLPESIRRFLMAVECEFLFGSTAPDVQVMTGQARQTTHFFNLPIQSGDRPAWDMLLAEHPCLSAAENLPASQAGFMAGYLCHLQADWMWIKCIFAVVFGPHCSWGTFKERLYYHNVLRAYIDRKIMPDLRSGMDACLHQVKPAGWLPFVEDRFLIEWREFLSLQLQPGSAPQTVEVFSSRQGISAPEYYALLESPERMQHEVFEHLPLERVKSYRQAVLDENARLLIQYLAFSLHGSGIFGKTHLSQGVHP